MIGCLAVSLVYDVVLLKGHPVLTIFPLGLAFIYHLMHGTVKLAVIAFLIPFALYIVKFVKGDIKKFDLLDLSMIGVIMGWPFCLITSVLAKVLHSVIQGTWVVRLLGRQREGYYAFPYTLVIVAAALGAYYLFKAFPGIEKILLNALKI